ncbi:MAG: tetratricopeptide repeat protein [Planctomycetota bacterium]
MADIAEHDGNGLAKQPERPRGRPALTTLCAAVVVAIAAFAFGWPTRGGGFSCGDDYHFVLDHALVNHPSLAHAGKLLTIVHGDLYQPLPMLSFQANYAMAGEDPGGRFPVSPFGFHLTNILLHVLNAVLAFLLAMRLSRSVMRMNGMGAPPLPGVGDGSDCSVTGGSSLAPNGPLALPVGLLTGLMFACHPFALEPVAWISGRMVLLATTFSLLVLLACAWRPADGRGIWPLTAGLAWILAILSKVLPSVPIAAALGDAHVHRRFPRRCWATYAVFLALGVAATVVAARTSGTAELMEATQAESTTAPPVRLLLGVSYYLENYVWPTRLSGWSPPARDVGFFSSATGVALLECCLLFAVGCLAWRHSRTSFLGLCLFVVLLSPFLAATTARRILAADRYMYLPIFGLHLAVSAVLVQVAEAIRKRLGSTASLVGVGAPCLALVTAWTVSAWSLAPAWAGSIDRARRIAEVYPDDANVWAALARTHVFEGQPDSALDVVASARERWPDNARLALWAGEAYRLKKDWPRAEAELRDAVEKMPDYPRALYGYALTLADLGREDEARTFYHRILERWEDFLPAATALARSYRAGGDADRAVAWFERAIVINPFHRDAHFELAMLYVQQREWARARELLASVLEMSPNDEPTMLNYGVTLAHLGRTDEALAAYDRLIATAPAAVVARLNRAALLASLDRAEEARREYREILATHPGHRDATIGLHRVLQDDRCFGELVRLWLAREQANGETAESRAWLTWAYVLNDEPEQAAKVIESIPVDADEHRFARWALAYDALRNRDIPSFRRILGRPVDPASTAPLADEHRQVIVAALSALPEEVRQTPPGLYALARVMADAGDAGMVRQIARRLEETPDASEWREAVGELLDILETGRNQSRARSEPRP